MKRKVSTWIAVVVFVGAVALGCAQATPPSHAMHKTIEITGCLQQGPVAKEYILLGNDGSAWGVTSADKDMYLNDYVGRTVTMAGDAVHPKSRLITVAGEQNSPPISQYIRAMDVAVDSENCKK